MTLALQLMSLILGERKMHEWWAHVMFGTVKKQEGKPGEGDVLFIEANDTSSAPDVSDRILRVFQDVGDRGINKFLFDEGREKANPATLLRRGQDHEPFYSLSHTETSFPHELGYSLGRPLHRGSATRPPMADLLDRMEILAFLDVGEETSGDGIVRRFSVLPEGGRGFSFATMVWVAKWFRKETWERVSREGHAWLVDEGLEWRFEVDGEVGECRLLFKGVVARTVAYMAIG
ncbi:hypothetical protein CC80DRAFT_589364 [Byssothecium circinans]|uniref:Uncharacterized protein n=1 Tax=Byssothecium circinans TaxID=147558 RepID=A0A6A5UC34_9PLEO|nr:hypothetical protein CC80DRAFT_589364 [Byssothecium circinans]